MVAQVGGGAQIFRVVNLQLSDEAVNPFALPQFGGVAPVLLAHIGHKIDAAAHGVDIHHRPSGHYGPAAAAPEDVGQ